MNKYFAKSLQGLIILTNQGGQYLGARASGRSDKILNASWAKNDTPLKKRLQDEITDLRDKIGFPKLEGDVTDHHIIPGNQIGQLVKKSMTDGYRVAGLEAVNKYLGSRPGIQKFLQPQIDDDENQAVDEVFASIFWFQFNLVLGPSQKIRGDDPSQNLDKPLLAVQAPETQQLYSQILAGFETKSYPTALSKFLSLEEKNINNIVWQKVDNQWYVPDPNAAVRKTPGTTGYCYYTYDGTFN